MASLKLLAMSSAGLQLPINCQLTMSLINLTEERLFGLCQYSQHCDKAQSMMKLAIEENICLSTTLTSSQKRHRDCDRKNNLKNSFKKSRNTEKTKFNRARNYLSDNSCTNNSRRKTARTAYLQV